MNPNHRAPTWLIGLLCALLALQGSIAAVHLLARAAHTAPGAGHPRLAVSDGAAAPQPHASPADDCGNGGTGHCVSAGQPALTARAPSPPGLVAQGAPVAGEVRFSSAHTQPPEPRPKTRPMA